MTLSAEQRAAVSQWIAAGDSLAVVQRKLTDELKVPMTYMEVRFLVDDLGLEMKTPAPKFSAPPAATPPPAAPAVPAEPAPKKGLFGKLKDAVTGKSDDALPAEEAELPEDEPYDEEAPTDLPVDPAADPLAASTLKLEVDRLTRPGTLASGTVTFSDGVATKWAMDQYGRLMLDAPKGYKPSQADVQAFQLELSTQLQRLGY